MENNLLKTDYPIVQSILNVTEWLKILFHIQ